MKILMIYYFEFLPDFVFWQTTYREKNITSRFEIAIYVETIIIGYVFIQKNFVCGVGRKHKLPLTIFFTSKFIFQSDLYNTFQVIYVIKIVFSLQFC